MTPAAAVLRLAAGIMLLMLSTCIAVVALDQTAKHLVSSRRRFHVVNVRRGWGSQLALRIRLALWLLGAAVAVVLSAEANSNIVAVGTGAIVGGAAGNLIDGVRRAGVLDFIDVRVWPVFNLADVAIVAGAILIAYRVLGR